MYFLVLHDTCHRLKGSKAGNSLSAPRLFAAILPRMAIGRCASTSASDRLRPRLLAAVTALLADVVWVRQLHGDALPNNETHGSRGTEIDIS